MTLVLFGEGRFDSDDFILRAYFAYCRLCSLPTEKLTVDRTEGKPFFLKADGERSEIHFSLSHSGKYYMCAISEKNVGADIQVWRDIDLLAMSKRLFMREITDKKEFYDRFTQGEARAKCEGNGLLCGMKEGGGINYDLFDGYATAIYGGEGHTFFTELFL